MKKGPAPENQENIDKQEINILFDELLAKAKENLKIAEEQWKELPGEGMEKSCSKLRKICQGKPLGNSKRLGNVRR